MKEAPSAEIQWEEIEKLRRSVHDIWNKLMPVTTLSEEILRLREQLIVLQLVITEFHLVRKLVYGAVGIVLISVLSSLIYLVIKRN